MRQPKLIAFLLVLGPFAWFAEVGAAPFALDDIDYWLGSGDQRAGLAIDWDGDDLGLASAPSLAWGYRWEGNATVETALRAILADDKRLFAKLSVTSGAGTATYGFGYDINNKANNNAFALDDETMFAPDGIATTESSDGAQSVDSADAYQEGWLLSFWHLATAVGTEATAWSSSGQGISNTPLVPSGWSSLAHTPAFSFTSYANDIVAAEVPLLTGDFNHDGVIDAADYTVWRDSLGSTTDLAADANGNQVIDAADYLLWKDSLAGVHPSTLSNSFSVPEPSTIGLIVGLLVGWIGVAGRARLRHPRFVIHGV